MIVVSRDLSKKIADLGASSAMDAIGLCRDIGEDPRTFFQNWDWSDADFSSGSVAGLSFDGAILDRAKFLHGDLSDEQIQSARSAENIVWRPKGEVLVADAARQKSTDQLDWPNKLYAIARHLQLTRREVPHSERHEAKEFALDRRDIVTSKEYGNLIRQLAYEAAELRDAIGRGEFQINHHQSRTAIKSGRVERAKGFIFTETATGWQCKLPDRAVFHKWSKGETLKANRTTQKFVALMLAKHGLDYESYESFPFDKIVTTDGAEDFAELLNGLLTET